MVFRSSSKLRKDSEATSFSSTNTWRQRHTGTPEVLVQQDALEARGRAVQNHRYRLEERDGAGEDSNTDTTGREDGTLTVTLTPTGVCARREHLQNDDLEEKKGRGEVMHTLTLHPEFKSHNGPGQLAFVSVSGWHHTEKDGERHRTAQTSTEGRPPYVNLPGPEHNPTLGPVAGNVTGRRGAHRNVEGTGGGSRSNVSGGGPAHIPMFLEEDPAPMFLEEALTPMFLEEALTPMFLEEALTPMFLEEALTPMSAEASVCASLSSVGMRWYLACSAPVMLPVVAAAGGGHPGQWDVHKVYERPARILMKRNGKCHGWSLGLLRCVASSTATVDIWVSNEGITLVHQMVPSRPTGCLSRDSDGADVSVPSSSSSSSSSPSSMGPLLGTWLLL
ncbi:hypothetical protein EYF80_048199 [Liparis tanakae]|uniref:Uncharacterized protein n=1 Tax=Liparis tanakae TaxID=230148 RepID=A0A4Z2FL39_9TELE|nr:hypothetical protein EYF80_048199 [Liparis tanakae]